MVKSRGEFKMNKTEKEIVENRSSYIIKEVEYDYENKVLINKYHDLETNKVFEFEHPFK